MDEDLHLGAVSQAANTARALVSAVNIVKNCDAHVLNDPCRALYCQRDATPKIGKQVKMKSSESTSLIQI